MENGAAVAELPNASPRKMLYEVKATLPPKGTAK
jgi:hypothetical protein